MPSETKIRLGGGGRLSRIALLPEVPLLKTAPTDANVRLQRQQPFGPSWSISTLWANWQPASSLGLFTTSFFYSRISFDKNCDCWYSIHLHYISPPFYPFVLYGGKRGPLSRCALLFAPGPPPSGGSAVVSREPSAVSAPTPDPHQTTSPRCPTGWRIHFPPSNRQFFSGPDSRSVVAPVGQRLADIDPTPEADPVPDAAATGTPHASMWAGRCSGSADKVKGGGGLRMSYFWERTNHGGGEIVRGVFRWKVCRTEIPDIRDLVFSVHTPQNRIPPKPRRSP